MGLIITVQGFETSRYLAAEYDAATRIRTMRISQLLSSAIYLVYITMTTLCFTDSQVGDSETAIVGMTQLVAPVLPVMLVAAALAAQFSAAVADTAGCGGLAQESTHQHIKAKFAYLLVSTFGVGLTWVADIYSIIALASRAFAAYYAVQCGNCRGIRSAVECGTSDSRCRLHRLGTRCRHDRRFWTRGGVNPLSRN